MREETARQVGRLGRFAGTSVATLAVMSVFAVPALAAPRWTLTVQHAPTVMTSGDLGQYALIAQNIGDSAAADNGGDPITMTDILPEGVTALDAAGGGWDCGVTAFPAQVVTCNMNDALPAPVTGPPPPGSNVDDFHVGVRGSARVLYVTVMVDADVMGSVENLATISGGGASPISVSDRTRFDPVPAGFGLQSLAADAFDAEFPDGAPVRQAGAHPFEARFDLAFNLKTVDDPDLGFFGTPVEDVRTIRVRLPQGFVGDPQATPRCTHAQLFGKAVFNGGLSAFSLCPAASQVGSIDLIGQAAGSIFEADLPDTVQDVPVYNMEPARGAVADFAFVVAKFPTHLLVTLDPADHYAVRTTLVNVPTMLGIRSSRLTLWGVPADPAHDHLRLHPSATDAAETYYGAAANQPLKPFLTLPSRCGVPGAASVAVASWRDPETFVSMDAAPATMTGCEKQRFDASMTIQPTSTQAGAPTGLAVELKVDQDQNVPGLGTPPLRKAVVTLPQGMAISPSSADGLAGCTPSQIGLGTNDPVACPDAAKIGSAVLRTPVLPDPISGSVYLAAQNENPFGSLLALYIVLEDKDRGLLIKLPGRVALDPSTGQVTTTFDDNPQVPFSSLRLVLKSGPRAPLVNPATCGQRTATAALTSWNDSLPTVNASDSFTISADGQGAACGAQPFRPTLEAGTENPVAGEDSTLITRITRPDGDQQLGRVDVRMPAGVLGRITKIELCTQAQASAGTCAEASRIGSATVLAGPGSDPFAITNGRVYLTGPYKGAPFGLSILVHAKAGPLDLGNVNVRAAVHVNRKTAALRILTDPLPRILAGIPLQLRVAEVVVDRPHFTFNPTSCAVKHATGRIASTIGAVARVRSRFKVGECGRLPFHPRMSLRVGRKGHTGAGDSTPLTTTLRMTKGQSNLSSVRVVLPLTLSARLEIVNQACTRAELAAGRCAKARAGSATARTPLLRDPLRGSAFFVQGAKGRLPDLVVALRGQVDVDLTGKVTILKDGRIATSFNTIPDVPIRTFTLRLVDGRDGPLGAVRNLCAAKARKARVDLTLRSQSGRTIHRAPHLKLKGCPQAK